MPVVTRRMSQQAKESKMDVDGWETTEISDPKKRAKGARKRNRKASLEDSELHPKKRRRVQKSQATSEDSAKQDSPPKKKRKTTDTPTRRKKKRVEIQAVSTSKTTTKPTEQLSDEEVSRIESMQEMEKVLYDDKDYQYVIGCDEAGRGPIAGPVVAAACYIPLEVRIAQLTDSKALTEEQREEIFDKLVNDNRVVYGVSVIPHTKIDEINILEAAMLGMREASVQLNDKLLATNEEKDDNEDSEDEDHDAKEAADDDNAPSSHRSGGVDYILVDGNRDPSFEQCADRGLHVESETVIKGDGKVYCIAAASIIAKVTRDRIMVEYDKRYPLFNFAQHKGYPTPQHKALVHEHGPCEIHRRSFQPVKSITGWERPQKPKNGRVPSKKVKKAAGNKKKKRRKIA